MYLMHALTALPVIAKTARVTASRLGAALRQVADRWRRPETAAIVMLTDGVTTGGEPLGQAARRAGQGGVPLYLVGVGSAAPAPDAAVSDLLLDPIAWVGQPLQVAATVATTGLDGISLDARLLDVAHQKMLASKKLTAHPAGQTQSVRFTTVPAAPGPLTLAVEVGPGSAEARTDNNRLVRTVQVRREPMQIGRASGRERG